ncbi:MAG TPA: fibronectin type III domain-containing protein [Methanomassiliicoccales archaeon]|nr:fibronectin type III domain-containing protein [Methanomassiliicoccales archaeon]
MSARDGWRFRRICIVLLSLSCLLLASATPIAVSFASAAPVEGAPTEPCNVTALPGNGQVSLSWEAPNSTGSSPVLEYWVYRCREGQPLELLVTLGNVRSYTDTGLTNGVSYSYRVAARNLAGIGSMSGLVEAVPRTVPTVPLDVRGSPGNLFINLSWSAPAFDGGAPVTSYCVYLVGSNGIENFLASTNCTYYVSSDLELGTMYRYRVSAVNIAGEGAESEVVEASPDILPGSPQDIAAQAGVRSITLSWSAPSSNGGSPLVGYAVLRGSSSGSEVEMAKVGTVTTYEDLALDDGSTYYYIVRAMNALGFGAPSAEVYARTADLVLPDFLAIVPGDGTLNLSWTYPVEQLSEVLHAWIYRSIEPGQEVLVATLGKVTSYGDTDLVNGQTYYYQIGAETAAGVALSEELSGTPRAVPDPPQQLKAVPGNGYVSLSWSAPPSDGGSPIVSYRVYRGGSLNDALLVGEGVTTTSYTCAGLNNGANYYFWVSACNSAGEGERSEPVQSRAGAVPDAPRDLVADVGSRYVRLSWTAPEERGSTPITEYRVYRTLVSTQETTRIVVKQGTTYNDTGLTNSALYRYVVLAVNSIGEGAPANISASPITDMTLPSEVQGLHAVGLEGAILLTWDAPADVGGADQMNYRVYRGSLSGALAYLATVTGTEFNNTNLPIGATYYYKVTAANEAGEGDASPEVNATVLAESAGSNGPIGFTILGNTLYDVILVVVLVAIVIFVLRFLAGRRARRSTRRSSSGKKNATKPKNGRSM